MNEIRYSKVFPRTKAALEKVPIEEVAKIAAMLVRNPASAGAKEGLAKEAGSDEKTTPSEATTRRRVDEENPLVGATAKAFELLEIAYYGKDGLTNRNSYEAGLAEFVEDKRIAEDFLKAVESLPGWEPEYDEQGNPLPVPFDEALAKLIPKPGVQASQTDDERMTRFRGWLSSLYSEPESDEQKWLLRMLTDQGHFTSQVIEADARQILVGEMIAKMKKEGIPPGLFSKACLFYPSWWKQHQREQKSAAGKKGQEIKQASTPKPSQKTET